MRWLKANDPWSSRPQFSVSGGLTRGFGQSLIEERRLYTGGQQFMTRLFVAAGLETLPIPENCYYDLTARFDPDGAMIGRMKAHSGHFGF